MEIVNTTPYLATCTIATDKYGQDHLLAIMKATFRIPLYRERPELVKKKPVPIVGADVFSGDPEHSSTLFESDYALNKLYCDVLLNGCAYAPDGKPSKQVSVGLKIGRVKKIIAVNGNRVWRHSLTKIHISPAMPFIKHTISYDSAYGGIDNFHTDKEKHTAYLHNPVGIGYHKIINFECIDGTPVPNTESFNQPIEHPFASYQPMAFGPIGRACPLRAQLAGTYNSEWQEKQFPFLPTDFDDRYFQSAPPDQQTDYLKGGETIHLINLTEGGNKLFKIPCMQQKKVVFYFFDGNYKIANFHVDTLHLLPEEGMFTLTARASIPLYSDPFSCSKVIIGRGSRGWQRALDHGKRYIPRIQALQEYEKKQKRNSL